MLGRHRLVEVIENEGSQTVKGRISDGLDSRGASKSFQNAHFPEKIAGGQFSELDFVRLSKVFADSNQTFANDEKPISGLAFANNDIACPSFDFLGAFPEKIQSGFIEPGEDWNVL